MFNLKKSIANKNVWYIYGTNDELKYGEIVRQPCGNFKIVATAIQSPLFHSPKEALNTFVEIKEIGADYLAECLAYQRCTLPVYAAR